MAASEQRRTDEKSEARGAEAEIMKRFVLQSQTVAEVPAACGRVYSPYRSQASPNGCRQGCGIARSFREHVRSRAGATPYEKRSRPGKENDEQ